MRSPESKIFQLSDLIKFLQKKENQKIVFTNGCFDLIHRGHVFYLNEAKKLGDFLIVALNSDQSVQRLKGPSRPIQLEEDRMYIMAGLECVDAVVLFHEDTPLSLIKSILPDVLVKGGDYTTENIVGAQEVLQNGGAVKTISFVDGKSTSNIVKKMQ
jgi:D-beta-D-heptose 7-phosphate kinase/D-beta-D-heptose 1-phosphate adenosyltransferase